MTLEQHSLPVPVFKWEVEDKNPLLVQERFNYSAKQVLLDKNFLKLNAGQCAAYDWIVDAVNCYPKQAHFFL